MSAKRCVADRTVHRRLRTPDVRLSFMNSSTMVLHANRAAAACRMPATTTHFPVALGPWGNPTRRAQGPLEVRWQRTRSAPRPYPRGCGGNRGGGIAAPSLHLGALRCQAVALLYRRFVIPYSPLHCARHSSVGKAAEGRTINASTRTVE